MKPVNEQLQLPDPKEVGPYEYHKQRYNMLQTFRMGSIYIQEINQRKKQTQYWNAYCLWDRGGASIDWK